MADTYLDLRTRIQDEVNNSAIATDGRVNSSILSAIAFYERERWWFNEARSNTFATVAAQEIYTSSDATWIDGVAEIDELTITVNGYRYQLEARTWDWLDARAVTTASYGQPSDYSYYNRSFRLYPIPDAAYTVRFSGAIPLTALSGDSDSNAWTTVGLGEGLIRARAKVDIYSLYAMDPDNAAIAKQQEQEQYASLVAANSRRIGTGRIVPQAF